VVDLLPEPGAEIAAARPALANADLERLDAALAELSAKERLVITLLEIEDRSVQEVSTLTGWSAANVKVRAFRARAILRKLLEKKP
jgi:RNA polymerase sigma-70 factor (ECF subfamily)